MNDPKKNGSSNGCEDSVLTLTATPPTERYWSYVTVAWSVWLHEMATWPSLWVPTEGKNWSPPESDTMAMVSSAHQYVRPTPVSYEHQTTLGCPSTIVMAGKESVRKPNPGSGLGRSWKPSGLILRGVPHPRWKPLQWASQIEPIEEVGEGYSSQVIQNPSRPSVARADPCEYFE